MKPFSHIFRPLAGLIGAAALALVLLPGCAHLTGEATSRRATSLIQYLYPKDHSHTEKPAVPTLTLPLRVGVAFVPEAPEKERGYAFHSDRLPQKFKTELSAQVAGHFRQLPFVKDIELIPTAYLQPGGGFANLDQLRQMFDVDVIALLSFDQSQNTDEGVFSLTYWTLVGAYVIPAEKNLTTTLLDAAVFDIPSRKLLFRAPGLSRVNGLATPINLSQALREDSQRGFTAAATNLVANLQTELATLQARLKERPDDVKIVHSPGYKAGAGAFGTVEVLLLAGLVLVVAWPRIPLPHR